MNTITRQTKVAEYQAFNLYNVEVEMLALIINAELYVERSNQ